MFTTIKGAKGFVQVATKTNPSLTIRLPQLKQDLSGAKQCI